MDLSQETPEGKESVEKRNTKQILIDTAEKCKLLIGEADELFSKGNSKGYKEKLVERGNLIARLPEKLAQATDIKTLERKEEILNVADLLALSAEKALEPKGKIYYGLSVLMGPESGETGGPNPLDVLIESIEK